MFNRIIKNYSRTVGQRNQIDDIMALTLLVQRAFGQQILDPDWTWKTFIYHQVFTVLLFVYIIIGTLDVLNDVADMLSVAEGFFTIMITCSFAVKYLIFVFNRNTFQKLYIIVKTRLFDFINEDAKRASYVIKRCKFGTKILFSIVLFPLAMYLTVAIYNYIIGTRVTLSKTTSILMPMTTPFYEIGLILHTIYLFEMAFTILVIDMWFVFLMFFYCVASDGLVEVLIVKRSSEDTEELYQMRLKNALRRFYFVHLEQTEYLNILVKMYKWASAVPLCVVFLCLCNLLFLMSEEINWTFGSNFVPTFAELFAYNWFGEQIKKKATKLNIALLDFDWPAMKLADKNKYLIIIGYMNKEFGIKTVFGGDLSLLTMSSVIKASYQACAVLQCMKK